MSSKYVLTGDEKKIRFRNYFKKKGDLKKAEEEEEEEEPDNLENGEDGLDGEMMFSSSHFRRNFPSLSFISYNLLALYWSGLNNICYVL